MQSLREDNSVTTSEIARVVNELIRNLSASDPSINNRMGQAAPPSNQTRGGKIAYADGTNWNPGQGEGYYYYNSTLGTWRKINLTLPNNVAVYAEDSGGTARSLILWNGSNAVYWGDIAKVYTGYIGITGTTINALVFFPQTGGTYNVFHSGYSAPLVQSVANPWIGTPTTARAFGSVYQNATNRPIHVAVSIQVSTTAERFIAYTDASNPPTTVVGDIRINAYDGQLCFIVLPGNYYEITRSSTGAVRVWAEWS